MLLIRVIFLKYNHNFLFLFQILESMLLTRAFGWVGMFLLPRLTARHLDKGRKRGLRGSIPSPYTGIETHLSLYCCVRIMFIRKAFQFCINYAWVWGNKIPEQISCSVTEPTPIKNLYLRGCKQQTERRERNWQFQQNS